MALVQILSPNPSLTFGSWSASNPASWTSPCDHFHLNLIQTNFCLLFYHLEIYKGNPFSVWTFTTKLLSPPSPLNSQPGTMKIHWSPVQNFKLHQLQVWTRFAKFGEIHSKPSPKIPSKFRQPLGALSDHLTKLQLQKNLSHSQNLLSNTCWTLLLSSSVKFS